jgi:integrase
MAKTTLTTLAIQNSKPARQGGVKVRTEIPDGGCKGLYLVVQPSGARSWAVRYRHAGQSRKMTLGDCIVLGKGEPDPGNGALTLASARKACTDALHRLAMGFDPAAEKLAQQKEKATTIAESFQAVAEGCFERAEQLRSASQQLANLRRLAFPVLGARPIASIRRSDIVRLLDTIQAENGPVMADAILSTISKVLNDHARRTDDFMTPLVRGMRRSNTKERARDRILSDAEIKALWKATEGKTGFALLFRFLLLTGARREEALACPKSEIDGTTWTLPAARNKAKQQLARPLSKAAQAVLASATRNCPGSTYVFTTSGNYPLGSIARRKRELDEASGVTGWTIHDVRRTARSLLARAGVLEEVAERCLGHAVTGVRGTYNRHDYQAEMLVAYEKLSTLIEHITDPKENVIPLAR